MSEITMVSGRRVKRGWMDLKVQEVIRETPDTDTFVLVDAADGVRAFDYYAGQYLTFRFDGVAAKPIVRSYTMSSSPCEKEYAAFTVKRVEKGLISNWLCDNVKVGSILRARGPIGRFCYESDKDAPHLVMIAGGSGVTPFVSIMREYADKLGSNGSPKTMTLLVSYRTREDIILKKDLEALKKIPGINIMITLSRESAQSHGYLHGRLTDQMLAQAFNGDYLNTTVMTCGPQAIMDQAVAHSRAHHMPEARIKQESFESTPSS